MNTVVISLVAVAIAGACQEAAATRNLLTSALAPAPAQAARYNIQYPPAATTNPPQAYTLGLDDEGEPALISNTSFVWSAVPSGPGYLLCLDASASAYSCLAGTPDVTEVQFGGLPTESTIWVWPAADANSTSSNIIPVGWSGNAGSSSPEVHRPFLGVQNNTVVMKNAGEAGDYQGKWKFTKTSS